MIVESGRLAVRKVGALIAAFVLFTAPHNKSPVSSAQETCFMAWLLPENGNADPDIVNRLCL